jgi:CTP synthase (UTP-ammonia lyase)
MGILTKYSFLIDFSSQLFRAMGYRVTAIKIDPYLNVDAGTMVRMK